MRPLTLKQRKAISEAMKQRWQDPDFRAKQVEANRKTMRARWQDPAFRDRHMEATVRRWQNPVFRRRQTENIIAGRRPPPFHHAPPGPSCDVLVEVPGGSTAPCVRRDDHAYHVAVTGTADEWTLRLYGTPEA